MLSIEIYVVALVTILVSYWIYKWRNPKCKGLLPPGSSGLPLVGESIELIIPSYNFDVHPFLKKRLQRYGTLFRTNVAGHNVVISADEEFNNFIFKQEEKLVVHWYLDLFAKIFKQEGKLMPDGLVIHKYTRNLALGHFGIESIKQKLLSQFEQVVQNTLHSWSNQDSIEVKSAFAAMYGAFGANKLYGHDLEDSKEFIEKFTNITKSQMSFPLNIPGTQYHKGLKVHKRVQQMIRDIVHSRVASPESNINKDDLLSKIIKDMKTIDFITEEFITQLFFALSYTSFSSIPSVISFAMKFISESPAVLKELIAEHDEILKKKEKLDSSITWEDYKSMKFTLQVVNETLRLGNSTPGFLRKAVKDIQVRGYTIPKGWGIMVCQSVMHLDPNLYKDPAIFNPWRWKDVGPEFISKYLTPFGGGMKQCAGADFVRVSMSIFIHIFVTKYRWTVVKGGDVIQNPILHFKDGLHISVSERGIN